jgi:RecA-family ATPase
MDWYQLEPPTNNWLVDGLITSDGYTSFCGKPKAGKSTLVRSLVVAIIKGTTFLGRDIDIPEGTGRVLYVHLDRKDILARVAKEFRDLGITRQEAKRITLCSAENLPEEYEDRLHWLQTQVVDLEKAQASPQLIVIDLLWQFVVAKNNNDYNAVLNGINKLQKALGDIAYKGALIVTLHGRKAESQDDTFDDTLGSTGQRGSFSTGIMLKRYRNEGIYTIVSDQTQRDARFGELEETILEYKDGKPRLGGTRSSHSQKEKLSKEQEATGRVLDFIEKNPSSTQADIMKGLAMSKKKLLPVLNQQSAFIKVAGEGEKGNPFTYTVDVYEPIMEVTNV